MHLPILPLSSNSHIYVEGDVSVDPSAVIASGVILRADPDSKIRIAADVCIGTGSILHAHRGNLEVETGANLGAGVLVVGKSRIGAHACIGAITTIWNDSIEPRQVVPPGSLVGNKERQLVDGSSTSTSPPPVNAPDTPSASISTTTKESLNGQVPSNPTIVPTDITEADSPTEPMVEESNSQAETSVYGQGNLNRLLKTLFPYNNQTLNPPPEDG